MPAGNGKGLFAAGAIALFDPASSGADYLPHLLAPGQGSIASAIPWLEGLQAREQGWRAWLAQCQILLLEDHPLPGSLHSAGDPGTGAALPLGSGWRRVPQGAGRGGVRLLICDLSLAGAGCHQPADEPSQYHHSGLPIILLSAHDQTLIDGARRPLHDAGFNVLAALAKPLQSDDLLRLLKMLYLGPSVSAGWAGSSAPCVAGRRGERTAWAAGRCGFLHAADLAEPERSFPSLGAAQALARAAWTRSKRTHPGHPPTGSPAEPGGPFRPGAAGEPRGARLALLLDHAQHLPFDLIERLPLQSLLLGQHLRPNWRRWLPTPCWPASSSAPGSLASRSTSTTPSTCRMPPSGRIAAWRGAGKWLAIFAGRLMSRACGRECRVGRPRLTGRLADDDGGGG